jgi:hypothetical protein
MTAIQRTANNGYDLRCTGEPATTGIGVYLLGEALFRRVPRRQREQSFFVEDDMPNDSSGHQKQKQAPDSGRDERRSVESEVAFRLRSRGVRLTGRETDEELVELLDAVERFERVVERHGGDLMVDEPMDSGGAREPDDRRFVLPRRQDAETVNAFIDRIAAATDRASR